LANLIDLNNQQPATSNECLATKVGTGDFVTKQNIGLLTKKKHKKQGIEPTNIWVEALIPMIWLSNGDPTGELRSKKIGPIVLRDVARLWMA